MITTNDVEEKEKGNKMGGEDVFSKTLLCINLRTHAHILCLFYLVFIGNKKFCLGANTLLFSLILSISIWTKIQQQNKNKRYWFWQKLNQSSFPLMCPLTCILREEEWLHEKLNCGHLCSFSPVWMEECVFKLWLKTNHLLHSVQL